MYIFYFADGEIDGETFLELEDEDINGISKKLGIRKKLKQLQVSTFDLS